MPLKDYPDYLLIKDLPGYRAGCIFSMGSDYIYFISYNPHEIGFKRKDNTEFTPSNYSLVRFNIFQISNNPEWFLEITDQVKRNSKIDNLLE